MRYGFVTCVELGKSCIDTAIQADVKFDILLTLKDDLAVPKSGRAYIDDIADENGIKLVKIRNINDEDSLKALKEADLDWLFIIGWSQIARPEVLSIPRFGVLGIHPTLLPQGRGRAAIPWAIIKGLSETGVTLFQLDDGVDTGPIVAQRAIPVDTEETATTLYAKMNMAHLDLIGEALPLLENSAIAPTPQNNTVASVWPGRTPQDGKIRQNQMTVSEVDRLVRATTHPYPGAFVEYPDGTILRVWSGRIASHGPAPGEPVVILSDGYYLPVTYEFQTSRRAN